MISGVIMKPILCLCNVILLFAVTACSEKDSMTYDYIIRGGTIIDGSGTARYTADIGITGDTITAIGTISADRGSIVIDASGKIVAPGFIDIHTHADAHIVDDRSAHNFVMQGVTTVVGGNCGGGRTELGDFFAKLEAEGIALNLGMLIGHNSVRSQVMGNEGRVSTEQELSDMKAIVEKAMKAGALGLSSGLKYRPGIYADTGEVVALAQVISRYGGFYATHLRDEGLKFFDAITEALEIGEHANIPVQLSHHKVVGTDMWGASVRSLAMIEEARGRGLDVTTDQYAYTATSTGIAILFPGWALEGTKEEIEDRLDNPGTRKKIIDGLVNNIRHDRGGNDIRNITITTWSEESLYEGKNLAEILEMRDREPTMEHAAELIIDLYRNGRTSAVYHCLSEEDVTRIMRHPMVMHGSDAGITEFGRGAVHPRNYGNFPRILGHYVRELNVLTLEEAIRKMTSFPAKRIGALKRGRLAVGNAADIVVFDPDTIADRATWIKPHQYPNGIDYVMVNGEIVVNHGTQTGKRPGRIQYGPGRE